jgi:nitronate monooxygenase
MFRVSGPDLVIAACQNGIIGSFPTINARTEVELKHWYDQIVHALEKEPNAAPYAVNLIINKKRNNRFDSDLDILKQYKPPIVITSVGSPKDVIPIVKSYNGLVFSDVASLKHARKAAALGVDGLILLCAGAGGNTGWLNPFAFVREVRDFYDGIIILAGGITDGIGIRAAKVLGCDLVYMGTKFIATTESMAIPDYKQKLINANIDDIMTTKSFSGIPANFLRTTIIDAGLDPDNLPSYSEFERSEFRKKRWKEIWSAGQGVGNIKKIESVSKVVHQLREEYHLYKSY